MVVSPSVRGLIAETEGSVPPVDDGRTHIERGTPLATNGDAERDTILLPDGSRIKRPPFPANKDLYKRVPREQRASLSRPRRFDSKVSKPFLTLAFTPSSSFVAA